MDYVCMLCERGIAGQSGLGIVDFYILGWGTKSFKIDALHHRR